MPSTTELEARLRGYALRFDREFPPTASVERRIMARIAITPRQSRQARTLRPEWTRAGGFVRELAMASVLVLLVGLLVVGAVKLRGLGPRPSSPPIGVIAKSAVNFSALDFVSADVGWIAETKAGPDGGPTVIFKTTDGGRTWHQQLSWDGPGPAQVRFSADGTEGLVVGQGGVPLYRTTDGGATWQRMALPPQAYQIALVYFLDAREGWVISYLNEATPGFAGVFHTTDGAQHWTQTARLDVNQVFSYARTGGSLQGSGVFHDSSTGWLIPAEISGTNVPIVPPFMYITHDGGTTWAVQSLPAPVGTTMNSGNTGISPPEFFNSREGVLLVTVFAIPPPGTQQPITFQGTYVYTTIDGGDHWSGPQAIALPGGAAGYQGISVLDARTWVISTGSGLARTTDAGAHWQVLSEGLPADGRVTAIDFQNANSGWAEEVVGGKPATLTATLALYGTTDGGAHWTKLTVPDLGG
jgi:photosystem II stability/assembly factor-like uncharacterized protein